MSAKKIALFIDADNISPKFGKQILETLESRGEIFIRRIYGNWQKNSLHGWNDCILNFSFRAVQQPDYVAGKNATDMSLTIDAMDILHGGKAEIFAIVSNDSDFTPLVIRLREGGMKIIGVGNAQAANSFRMACNEFIDLDAPAEVKVPVAPKKISSPPEKILPVQMNLFNEENPVEVKTQTAQIVQKISPAPVGSKVIPITDSNLKSDNDKKIEQLHDVLHEAAQLYGDGICFIDLGQAGKIIAEKNLTVKGSGHGNLIKFIAAFPHLYEIKIVETGALYRCLDSMPKIFKDKLQHLHEILREAARLHGNAEGFVLLNMAGLELKNENLGFGVKDFGYTNLQDFILASPNRYEIKKFENTVYYRCIADKLKSIHEILRETARVHKDSNGFTDLTHVGQNAREKDLNLKNSGHSSWSKFISAFPNLYEVKSIGKSFYYRCR